MTIEEHIKRMGDIRSNYDRWSGLGLTPNEAKAFDVAIETMRKYQKIEQIINNAKDSDGAVKYNWLYEQIKKVVENGNDD